MSLAKPRLPEDIARRKRIATLSAELRALMAEERAAADRRKLMAMKPAVRRAVRLAVSAMTAQQREDYRTFCSAGFGAVEAVTKVVGNGWRERREVAA